MTFGIPSKAFQVWQRLYLRFLLEPLPATETPGVTVGKMIVPVTQADELLASYGIKSSVFTYTAGQAVQINVHTCPDDKRWTLFGVDGEAQLTGDNLTDRFMILDASAGQQGAILTDFTAVARKAYWLPQPLKMEAGDNIQIRLSGAGVAAGQLRTNMWLAEEDIF